MVSYLQELFYSNLHTEIARWSSLALVVFLVYKSFLLSYKFLAWVVKIEPSEFGSQILQAMSNPTSFEAETVFFNNLKIKAMGPYYRSNYLKIYTSSSKACNWELVSNSRLTESDGQLIYNKAVALIDKLEKEKIQKRLDNSPKTTV